MVNEILVAIVGSVVVTGLFALVAALVLRDGSLRWAWSVAQVDFPASGGDSHAAFQGTAVDSLRGGADSVPSADVAVAYGLTRKAMPVICAVCLVLCFAVMFVRFHVYLGTAVSALQWCVAVAMGVFAGYADFKTQLIPNKIVGAGCAASTILLVCEVLSNVDYAMSVLANAATGVCLGVLVFSLARVVTRGGVGFGDIKLYAVFGLLVSFQGVLNILFVSMIAAFVASLALLALRKARMGDNLSLAPFACFGVIVSALLGS